MKEGLEKVIEAVDAILPQDLEGTSILDKKGNFPESRYNLRPFSEDLPLLQPDMPNLEWKIGRGRPKWYRNGQQPLLFRRLYRATGAELGPDVIPSEEFDAFRFDKRVYDVAGEPWLAAYFQAHWYEGVLNVDGEDFAFDSSMKIVTATLGLLNLEGGIGETQASMQFVPSRGRLDFHYPPLDMYEGQNPLAYVDPDASDIDNSITILSLVQGDVR
ncbi:MAG: hypothetical protein QG623_63 [Patescibacteria group bacterium]|nr:hypothetical protein [Patescibacteria group bacterium]